MIITNDKEYFMRNFLASIFKKIASKLENVEPQRLQLSVVKEESIVEEEPLVAISGEIKEVEKRSPESKKSLKDNIPTKKTEVIPYKENPARDLMEMMEIPFLALSKNRKNPIIYESQDGRVKVKVSRHTGHFLASIYDWDIVLFVSSKMQEILNKGQDIPPRTLIVPRHEILRSIHKINGKKTDKDLEKALSRLQLTGIETSIRNEDYKYKAGFGFLDSWGYTKRKDIKEVEITLSQWLYDGICAKRALLRVNPSYFDLTSGLKKFLYRTARKHLGKNKDTWEFSVQRLYEKSGSERELKKFKSDLKVAVLENNIPEYSMDWVEKNRKALVIFKRSTIQELERRIEKFEKKQ
jgi:plasmid replication initiation protein